MATNHGHADAAGFEADVIYQQLGALNDAALERHRLPAGSAEYVAALELEKQLADHIWQMATDIRLKGAGAGPADRPESET